MERCKGYHLAKKPVISPHFALGIALLSIADILFLTKLQKRENPSK